MPDRDYFNSEKSGGLVVRRRVDALLTALTTALFLAPLCLIIVHPDAFSTKAIIGWGFALILYSVCSTWLYQWWISNVERRGGLK